MKRLILLLFTVHCSLLTLVAQAPQAFNYQAVVRDDAGNILSDQTIGIRISILQGSVSGAAIYSETHSPTTNEFGLVTLEIGGGTTSDDFSAIDWGADLYFLKIEMDATGGTSYTEMGTTQLLSVPYALFAENATDKDDADADPENEIQDLVLAEDLLTITGNPAATDIDLSVYLDNTDSWVQNGDAIFFNGDIGIGTDTPGGKLEVVGDGSETSEDALFEVRRNDGQTVFAVYPEGVRIYVDDSGTKGTKGGFAIGGFNPATKGLTNEFLRVTPDSVRVYVNDEDTKGTKGGFAIGGFSPATKDITNEYLRVSPDSVRVYVDDDASKGTKGGFAIGGFSPLKSAGEEYLRVTPDSTRIFTKDSVSGFAISNLGTGESESYLKLNPNNYFIGHEAGKANTTGIYNSFIGFQAGISNTTGDNNSFMGFKSGFSNELGSNNILIGNLTASIANISRNSIIIGSNAGSEAFSTTFNDDKLIDGCIYIGYETGEFDRLPYNNIFIGEQAGRNNMAGNGLFLGVGAGRDNKGQSNIFIGNASGNKTEGDKNVFIGWGSGQYNVTGEKNIYFGHETGILVDSSSNNIFLGYQAGRAVDGSSNICIGELSGTASSGSNNIYIGFKAGGLSNQSNKLIISQDYNTSLISGDFLSNRVGIGDIDSPTQTLDVNGNARFRSIGSGAYSGALNITSDGTLTTATSDLRLKQDIVRLQNCLQKVRKLQGVNFKWKSEPEMGNRVGFIAQEVEKVFPELVFTNTIDGYKGVNYAEITAVLVEAMKEQQEIIDNQNERINQLEKLVYELMGRNE